MFYSLGVTLQMNDIHDEHFKWITYFHKTDIKLTKIMATMIKIENSHVTESYDQLNLNGEGYIVAEEVKVVVANDDNVVECPNSEDNDASNTNGDRYSESPQIVPLLMEAHSIQDQETEQVQGIEEQVVTLDGSNMRGLKMEFNGQEVEVIGYPDDCKLDEKVEIYYDPDADNEIAITEYPAVKIKPDTTAQYLIVEGEEIAEELHIEDKEASTADADLQSSMVFECLECDLSFTGRAAIESHMKEHFQKDDEEMAVRQVEILKSNQGVVGSRSKNWSFACKLCNKRFLEESYLYRHMVDKHGKEKGFVCKVCGKQIQTPSHMKRHMLSHTKEKPHRCELCGKHFNQICHIKKHLTHKHPDYKLVKDANSKEFILVYHHEIDETKEKPFQCLVCDQRFTKPGFLQRHMVQHTEGKKEHICEFCQKKFQSPFHLERHKRTHTKEKPFVCQICGHRFTQKGNLLKHHQSHLRSKNTYTSDYVSVPKFKRPRYVHDDSSDSDCY